MQRHPVAPWLAIAFAACRGSPAPRTAPEPAVAAAPAPASCDALHLSLVETGDAQRKARLLVAGEGLEPSPAKVARLVTGAAVEACRADGWPDAVVRCVAGDDLVARARCLDALSDGQRAHLRARVDEAIATIPAVAVARETREAWRDLATRTGVPACDAFVAAVNRLARCSSLPGILRDQLGEAAGLIAWASSIAAAAGSDLPPDSQVSAATGCIEAQTLARRAATSFACAATD